MAQELGLFAQFGLDVALSRELGWASIQDKLRYRELDAAQAVPGILFATGGACVTPLVLNLHGNAITVSAALYDRGARDAATLRDLIRADCGRKTYTFGMVALGSSHHFLLRAWLETGGIVPDRDVRLVVVPPPQMFSNLRAGHLDGYCVGEPWNSAAIAAGAGYCIAISRDLNPGHIEKVLAVHADFATHRAAELQALGAAVLSACAYCDQPAHRPRVAATLAHKAYLNAPARLIAASLCGPFPKGGGLEDDAVDFHIFHGPAVNRPDAAKARWVANQLHQLGLLDRLPLKPLFRTDLYEAANQLWEKANEPKLDAPVASELVSS